jgi:hypothetical protein
MPRTKVWVRDVAIRVGDSVMAKLSVIPRWLSCTIKVAFSCAIALFVCYLLVPLSKGQEASKAAGVQLDAQLLGRWTLVRTLVVVSDPEKVAVKYWRRYAEWDFNRDGTVLVTITYRFNEARKRFNWRTLSRDGVPLLELLDGEETFLMARYVMKKDEMWLAISLHPKDVKTNPPKTFDPEKESDALFLVLAKHKQK